MSEPEATSENVLDEVYSGGFTNNRHSRDSDVSGGDAGGGDTGGGDTGGGDSSSDGNGSGAFNTGGGNSDTNSEGLGSLGGDDNGDDTGSGGGFAKNFGGAALKTGFNIITDNKAWQGGQATLNDTSVRYQAQGLDGSETRSKILGGYYEKKNGEQGIGSRIFGFGNPATMANRIIAVRAQKLQAKVDDYNKKFEEVTAKINAENDAYNEFEYDNIMKSLDLVSGEGEMMSKISATMRQIEKANNETKMIKSLGKRERDSQGVFDKINNNKISSWR